MTQMIAITILVPADDIWIDAEVTHYKEERHEPAWTDIDIDSVSITGCEYEVLDWDAIDIDNLAVERFNEE